MRSCLLSLEAVQNWLSMRETLNAVPERFSYDIGNLPSYMVPTLFACNHHISLVKIKQNGLAGHFIFSVKKFHVCYSNLTTNPSKALFMQDFKKLYQRKSSISLRISIFLFFFLIFIFRNIIFIFRNIIFFSSES